MIGFASDMLSNFGDVMYYLALMAYVLQLPDPKLAIALVSVSETLPILTGFESAAIKSSKDLGRFWFQNDVELHLISYEAVERMRGKGYYLIVCDEPASWTKGLGLKDAWQGIIEPCIVTRWSPRRVELLYKQYLNARRNGIRAGRAVIIGTPKGYNYLYDMFNAQEKDSLWKSFHFDYTTSPFLDPDEIERLRHTIDPLEFNQEYKASFEDSGLSVFYNFNRKIHVRNDLEDFKDDEDVHIGIDFNVGKLCRPTINLVNSGKLSIETILIQAYSEMSLKEQRLSRKGVHPSGWKRQTLLDFTIL